MDYKRLIYFLFENFIALSALIMTILMVILKYKRKLKNTEYRKVTDLQDIKPDQIKRAPNNLSDIGMTAGWIIRKQEIIRTFS